MMAWYGNAKTAAVVFCRARCPKDKETSVPLPQQPLWGLLRSASTKSLVHNQVDLFWTPRLKRGAIQQQLLLLLFPELLSSLSFPCPVLLLLCLHPISECLLTAQWEPYWWAFLLLIQRPNSTRHWPPCQYHFFLGCCNGPCCMAVTVVALAPRKRVELLWVLLLYSLGNKNVKEGPQYKKMLFECLFTY